MRKIIAVLGAMLIAGCASAVVQRPAHLAATQDHAAIEIAKEARIGLSTGYHRTLPAGSRWEASGNLPEGTVYRRLDGIFTVEGADVHEAYLVISEKRLVGFYLPVEQTFTPTEPVVIDFK